MKVSKGEIELIIYNAFNAAGIRYYGDISGMAIDERDIEKAEEIENEIRNKYR